MNKPDMKDIHFCVVCGKRLETVRAHVDTCGETCFRKLLVHQRQDRSAAVRNPKLAAIAPKPRAPLVSKMCERCPFKPDGSGYAVDHPDFESICAAVDMRGEFYCHETVVLDERTTMDASGDMPDPPFQPHFQQCQGAWQRYIGKWEQRAEKALAERAPSSGPTRSKARRRG